MKVCGICGEEIWTKDGENHCTRCDGLETRKAIGKSAKTASRRIREGILRDMGLIKVRGALGGTYWE